MSDFRLEDLWAIIQGLGIVAISLFSVMALIALWPKIRALAAATWHRYVVFSWSDLTAWMADLDRERVNSFEGDGIEIMSREDSEPSRTNGRTERTNERSPHDRAWEEFLLDRTRERLIAVMVDSDLTVTEIRALLKGESAAIGQEIEAARRRLGKAPSQPYTTPIAGRPTRATFETDPELAYQPPPR